MNKEEALIESHEVEAAHAAAIAAEALTKSRRADLDDAVSRGLEAFFNRNIESGRFIPMKDNRMADVERFKFICDQIDGIHTTNTEIKNANTEIKDDQTTMRSDIQWIKWLVMGGVAGVFGLTVILVTTLLLNK